MIPGIDLSGTVEASSYSGIEVGDKVRCQWLGPQSNTSRRLRAKSSDERRLARQDSGAALKQGCHG
jgi:NADPH:quinone reductase-like Zn-dependent oxidoreductase